MKTKIILFLFALPFFSISQEKALKLGFSLYGNISQNVVSGQNGHEDFAAIFNDVERAKPSVGFQIFAAYPMRQTLFLQVGLGYLNYGEQTPKYHGTNIIYPNQIDPFYGFVQPQEFGPSKNSLRILYNYHSIEIPVQLKWNFSSRWYVQGGLSALINVGQTTVVYRTAEGEFPDISADNSGYDSIKTFNMAVNAGVGFTFCKGKETDWFVGLNAQHTLFNVAENTNINRKYFSAGFTVGMIF